MNSCKVVFTDYYYPHIDRETKILKDLGDVEIVDATKLIDGGAKAEDDVIRVARDADALIVQFAQITRRVLDALPKCRIVARYAIGLDVIDVQAAREKGVVVANVPDYCIEEVSDTALAHILNCQRRLSFADRMLHQRAWDYAKIKPIRRLANQTVGLLAFGHIARRLADKLRPYGNRIIAYDPYVADVTGYEWVERVSLETLIAQSDIISLHASLSSDTRGIINQERIAAMKDGVILINTSRGGLIDEAALEGAIKSGKIGMAGLDVLDCPDNRLCGLALCAATRTRSSSLRIWDGIRKRRSSICRPKPLGTSPIISCGVAPILKGQIRWKRLAATNSLMPTGNHRFANRLRQN